MTNPILALTGKDAIVILLMGHALMTFLLVAIGAVLWALAHWRVWR